MGAAIWKCEQRVGHGSSNFENQIAALHRCEDEIYNVPYTPPAHVGRLTRKTAKRGEYCDDIDKISFGCASSAFQASGTRAAGFGHRLKVDILDTGDKKKKRK